MTDLKNKWFLPAEWEKHQAVWLAWPSAKHLWKEQLKPAQEEFLAFCRGIAGLGQGNSHKESERLEILIPDLNSKKEIEIALKDLNPRFHLLPFGDIWLRDTGPLFLRNSATTEVKAFSFGFNGWGGKYLLPGDSELGRKIAEVSGLYRAHHSFILEGGSIESDGQGTLLTTRQCLLNSNRNKNFSQTQVEEFLKKNLGAEKVLWLEEGLINDHTDGHIDTLARFIAPGEIICMEPSSQTDPNAGVLKKIINDLMQMRDAKGRLLKVHKLPSPGKVEDHHGQIMPASYMNFYISNENVLVPLYDSPHDQEAVQKLSQIFMKHPHLEYRKILGISARAILSGGGAFHCISQQQPSPNNT